MNKPNLGSILKILSWANVVYTQGRAYSLTCLSILWTQSPVDTKLLISLKFHPPVWIGSPSESLSSDGLTRLACQATHNGY